MRFTDRKTLFTDRIPLLSIRSIRTDRQTVYNYSCHENILSPTNEMRFTDRKTLVTDRIPLLSICSIRTDRHMAYTDRDGAGVLDNPRSRSHGQLFRPYWGSWLCTCVRYWPYRPRNWYVCLNAVNWYCFKFIWPHSSIFLMPSP